MPRVLSISHAPSKESISPASSKSDRAKSKEASAPKIPFTESIRSQPSSTAAATLQPQASTAPFPSKNSTRHFSKRSKNSSKNRTVRKSETRIRIANLPDRQKQLPKETVSCLFFRSKTIDSEFSDHDSRTRTRRNPSRRQTKRSHFARCDRTPPRKTQNAPHRTCRNARPDGNRPSRRSHRQSHQSIPIPRQPRQGLLRHNPTRHHHKHSGCRRRNRRDNPRSRPDRRGTRKKDAIFSRRSIPDTADAFSDQSRRSPALQTRPQRQNNQSRTSLYPCPQIRTAQIRISRDNLSPEILERNLRPHHRPRPRRPHRLRRTPLEPRPRRHRFSQTHRCPPT